MAVSDWISGKVFNFVHGNNLVYNTCWEDPRLDRVALKLTAADRVLVITSAGCNALDYVLAGAGHVDAVDMNPRQNALLELKLAAVRSLEFEDYFQMFGNGHLAQIESVYTDKLRQHLTSWSQKYWDKRYRFFENPKRSFYFRGTSGSFARMINIYINKVARVRPQVNAILAAKTLDEQRAIYASIYQKIWGRSMRFAMNRDTILSLLGIPKAQRQQIDKQYPGGIVKFVQDSLESVFAKLPIQDNYFWHVYTTGRYTRECCPEYLKPENAQRLRDGLWQKISIHTDTVQGAVEKSSHPFSRFVLLDHMDWLSDRFFSLLESEWQAIIDRAAPETRILWRSGGLKTDFLNRVTVRVDGKPRKLPELLVLHEDLAAELHEKDRVHTYGSFYIADLKRS